MISWQGLFSAMAAMASMVAQAPVASQDVEYQVKAAFLYNFTQFVEWPDEAFAGPSAPLNVCVAGADPFGGVLDEFFAGERYQGRPYAVRRLRPADDLTACHLLFVPRSVPPDAVLSRPLGEATLMVGESPDFLAAGGIVNFYLEENKVRFEIHQTAAERSVVRISSRLMRLARLVSDVSALLYTHVRVR